VLATYIDKRNPAWAYAQCGTCRKWVLLRHTWNLNTQVMLIHGQAGQPIPHVQDVFPTFLPSYQEAAVPDAIRVDLEEALRCDAAGFYIGAALVGRRALQTAIRNVTPADVKNLRDERLANNGRKFPNLWEEINDLPDSVLGKTHRDAAHGVRLIGNDAAHSDPVSADDAAELLDFTSEVLRQLYVFPAQVKAHQERRAAKNQPT
jgi:hypothetical protein